MDLKRNYQTNIQPPSQIKSNNLINPIAAITNASTPVRTRIIKPGSQLNSTPVNVHKIGIPAKTPTILNKENQSNNSKIGLKRSKIGEQNINLSPIMALNRKMSEMPLGEQRSFTPNGFRRQQSLSNILQHKMQKQDQVLTQNLHDSRSQSTFRSMLQSRSKSPTRTPFAEMNHKNNNQFNDYNSVQPSTNTYSNGFTNTAGNGFGLRTSGSAQSLLQLQGMAAIGANKLKESRSNKLMESRSFQQLINVGTAHHFKDEDILCCNSNQHERKVKAKYKVIQEPQDQQLLVYCSKCAINLVQKGFKVQDLTQSDIRRLRSPQSQPHLQPQPHPQSPTPQYSDYAHQVSQKLQIKLHQLKQQKQSLISAYKKEIEDVDCYYNSLISMIEHQKNKDRQFLILNKEKEKVNGDRLEKKINDAVCQIGFILRNGRIGGSQVSIIRDCEGLLTEKGFGYRFDGNKCLIDKIQLKFNHFSDIFQLQGKLRLESTEREERSTIPTNYFSNPPQTREREDCPLRFSFQKNMRETKKSPLGFRNNQMNALQQAPQALQGEESNQYQLKQQKKAFRTLFPEQEEQQGQRHQGIHSPTFKQI